MMPLIVIDPALGRTGAHNLGFVELLAAQDTIGECGVCGNTAMDAALLERLASRCSLVEPIFDLDFYALAGKAGGVADHWGWIYALSRAYMAAFERVLARWPSRPVRLLYHTLSWEHANALALAIRLLGSRGDCLQHITLLMYSPGIDEEGRTLDPQRRLNFRLAFRALQKAGDVALYAGCGEYAEAYRHLLYLPAALPLHPCFIGDWRRRHPPRSHGAGEQVLLYLGEIKQDKGFQQLPERLVQELAVPGPARRFVLQFAAVRNPAARVVVDALHALAARHPNVEVHEGFWSDAQLDAMLATSSVLRLDYDPAAYVHKTSGLLWLAAWHRLAVTVPAGGWLEREARRLGVSVIPDGKPGVAALGRIDQKAHDPGYFRALFTPFWDWVAGLPASAGTVALAPDPAPAIAATRVARSGSPPAGQGADVVMFWKQNDSTLYGRRNDMVARYLASRPDVRRVLLVDAPIDEDRLAALAANRDPVRQDGWIAERTLDKLAGRHDHGKLAYTVFVHPRAGYAIDEVDRPTPAFLAAYTEFLADEFARFGIEPERAVYWVYPKNFPLPALLQRFPPARLVLDVVDDHRAWPGVSEAERTRLGEHYRDLLARADLAMANCRPVQQAMAALGREPVLVPNGCDTAMPVAGGELGEALREQLAFAGRTLGFVGNLEAKIDVDLLSRLAESFPDCRLVLIGSTHANPEVLALRRHCNVRMPGVVPYDSLGAWLSTFSVGLIPHLRMDLTRYMNPLKAYVYLAAGVPIVATAVPNVEAVPELVRVADDHDGFVRHVAAQLAQERPPRSLFDAAVARSAWAARLAPHVDSLDLGRLPA